MKKGDKIQYSLTTRFGAGVFKGKITATKRTKRGQQVYIIFNNGNTGGWYGEDRSELTLWYEVFEGCDVTPLTHPGHHVVGKEFLGTNFSSSTWDEASKKYKTVRWFCAAHDQEGYWMFATDGSGEWHNVSGRAIGASFHLITEGMEGRLLCSFAQVPAYDHSKLHNLGISYSFGMYRGYEIKLTDGLFSVWKNGRHVYTLRTISTEQAAKAWIDTEVPE
jgi:hypothetical protein